MFDRRKTRAKILGNARKPTGEPIEMIHPDVAEFRIDGTNLIGLDRRGRAVLVLHCSDVAAAVIEEVPHDR